MALAEIIGSPKGLLFIQEHHYELYVPAAAWSASEPFNAPWHELPRDELMSHMEKSSWIVDSEEVLPEGIGAHFLQQIEKYFDSAYLAVPLLLEEKLFGFAVLKKKRSGTRLNYEDIDLLRTSGRQVASYLAQHYTTRRLAEAQEFETYGRMTAFLIHDLKNIMAQQSLVVQNAARHKHNPSFIDDAVATLQTSLERMSGVLKQLRVGTASSNSQKTDLRDVVADAVNRCRAFAPTPEFDNAPAPLFALADPERLAFGLTNLVRNAQQATTSAGRVRVRLFAEPRTAVLEVIDDGSGMSESFVQQRLFRPFDSTSAEMEIEMGMGLGAFQLRETVRAIGGTVSVQSGRGRGSRFEIRIPLSEP
jgi:putative PEP-CTERM system histidine kinase